MRKIIIPFLVASFFACSSAWAERIVSLLPSNTEILEALGDGNEVVGVTRFDRVTADRTVVGDFFQPNLEKIVALKPDLIISGLWVSSRANSHLKKMGYRIIEVRNPGSLDELYRSIQELSKAVHREAEAQKVIADMKARFTKIAERAKRFPKRLRTYIEIDSPFWTVGGHDFLTEAAAYAGADNIFSDLKRPSAQISPEVVVERDPELIVSFGMKKNEIASRPGWANVAAVRNHFILDDLDSDALSHPSPRIVNGVEELESRIEQLLKK